MLEQFAYKKPRKNPARAGCHALRVVGSAYVKTAHESSGDDGGIVSSEQPK